MGGITFGRPIANWALVSMAALMIIFMVSGRIQALLSITLRRGGEKAWQGGRLVRSVLVGRWG